MTIEWRGAASFSGSARPAVFNAVSLGLKTALIDVIEELGANAPI